MEHTRKKKIMKTFTGYLDAHRIALYTGYLVDAQTAELLAPMLGVPASDVNLRLNKQGARLGKLTVTPHYKVENNHVYVSATVTGTLTYPDYGFALTFNQEFLDADASPRVLEKLSDSQLKQLERLNHSHMAVSVRELREKSPLLFA